MFDTRALSIGGAREEVTIPNVTQYAYQHWTWTKRGGRPRPVLIVLQCSAGGEVQWDTRPYKEAYPGLPPLLNAELLTRFARPRRVRMVFGAKGERVRTSATSPFVLVVMRRRVPELQICDVGSDPPPRLAVEGLAGRKENGLTLPIHHVYYIKSIRPRKGEHGRAPRRA